MSITKYAIRTGVLALVAMSVWASTLLAAARSAAPAPTNRHLRVLATKAGMPIGTAIRSDALASDSTYAQLAGEQFNSVTPEFDMLWSTVEPTQGVYNWAPADADVAFARAHGQKVHGFDLVDFRSLPAWLTTGTFTNAQLTALLHKHITDEVTHFKGRIWQWDVVNEPFNEDGTLRSTIWLNAIGPDYIADVLKWAHQADPHALLFLNDFNIEFEGPKSDAALELAKSLKSQGVPIDGVGIEAHLALQFSFPGTDALLQNMMRFAAAGLAISITEADVRFFLPATPDLLATQASEYAQLLEACLPIRACTSFTVWGFTDKYSWIPGFFTGQGAATIYDESFNPKPAYSAVQHVLAVAPQVSR